MKRRRDVGPAVSGTTPDLIAPLADIGQIESHHQELTLVRRVTLLLSTTALREAVD